MRMIRFLLPFMLSFFTIKAAEFTLTLNTLTGHYCLNSSTFTPNSTYHANLNRVLDDLVRDAGANPDNGFNFTSSKASSSNAVYGSFMCRGDVSKKECADCVGNASIQITQLCPMTKVSFLWYDRCMLRYSDTNFTRKVELKPRLAGYNEENIYQPAEFMKVLTVTMDHAAREAAQHPPRMYGHGDAKFSQEKTLYTFAQCVPYLSKNDCWEGLRNATSSLLSLQEGKIGGRVLLPSCFVRFEIYPFYGSSSKGLEVLDSEGRRKIDIPVFDFETVAAATSNFSFANKLGQGGFGSVYKGVMNDGTEIAVKRLSKYSGQGNEEFKNEVRLIAKLQHRNLVKILGCCIREDEKLLIYEYLPNKSLESLLYDETKRSLLDWGKRYEIAYGVARGLMYLHQDSILRIIHRDLKVSNVLLDVALNPKISDFGLARICGGDQIEGKTKRVVGTYGYMAPEYAMQGQFSIKSDVYSYGVLLLEIITGQRNSGCYHMNPFCYLIGHVWELWKGGNCMDIADKSIGNTYSEEIVSRCIQIGLLRNKPLCICKLEAQTVKRFRILDGNLLVSSGKRFALGFFSPGNSSHRYVGIWYYQVSEQTIVWVANRERPINGTSGALSIDSDGKLVLHENGSFLVWSTNVSSALSNYSTTARLMDSGNLVLVQDFSERVIWQSFDYPTDTMLPFMKLGLNRKTGLNRFLTSWKSPEDPTPGNCSYRIDPTGYTQLLLYKDGDPYWRAGSWTGDRWSGIPEMTHSFIFNVSFVNDPDEVSIMYGVIDASIITRMVVSESGSLRRSTWLDRDQRWIEFWYAPKDQCDYYSRCGPNSNCNPYDTAQFECTCLPGFEPKSPTDWDLRDGSAGCVRRGGVSVCRSGEGFVKVARVKVPDTTKARANMSLNLKECKEECVRDCSCTAYASASESLGGSGCLMWHGYLLDTRTFAHLGQDLYVRVDAIALGNRDVPLYDLSTIASATNNFSVLNKLGQGGFGSVYKGVMDNGTEIAVKRLSKHSGQGVEEFKSEVRLIAKLQHRNLLRILGCCVEKDEKMLIYEYLPNKSLDAFLFDKTRTSLLDWRKRFEIASGLARGLLYLHQDSRLRIIHRDLKASNVLLDEAMNPKISDFGMARICGADQIQGNTNRVVGTYGYMSPEYAMEGIFSIKSDVYSFGVLLLEIISGKRNSAYYHENPSSNLVGHVSTGTLK
ncbi:hypothetical protein EUGRSUZ_D00886 [Eucalyptus grandis]|uniref:Uncharacterized protein n=2 Tax=Eucalyptus grandis TaxID=71139 RepID=A0ACC3L429_EUCGR|nr:hypothetical protein EUGRSUZ_D00886 [Eucalyptus grandis]